MVVGIIVGSVIGLALNIWMSIKMAEIARLKGYSPEQIHAFAICFFFGTFGWLYVAALPTCTYYRDEKLINSMGNGRLEHKEILKKLEALEQRLNEQEKVHENAQ